MEPEDRDREERALRELITVFYDGDRATWLATAAGVPKARIPSFTTPLLFWSKVVEEARHGLLRGGIRPIIESAAEMYPNNPTFADFVCRLAPPSVRDTHNPSEPRVEVEFVENKENNGKDADQVALGRRTVASVRKDEPSIVAVAAITGLSKRVISNTLSEADGRFRVRTVFAERWPGENPTSGDDGGETSYIAEELANCTVAAARENDDVLDALVSITGRSLRRVRNTLAASDGRVHLRNAFARWWPEPFDGKGAEIDVLALGSLTVASARDDAAAIAAIEALTGLGERTVSSKLSHADGRYRVRTIFSHRWPVDEAEPSDEDEEHALYSPDELGEWTVAAAREDDDALESLEAITGLSLRGVRRNLNGANGRALLRNVFAHRWPAAEDEQDEEDPGESTAYSVAELANWTVAAARGDDEVVQSLAAITGISPRWVRRHLNGANGKVRVRNLFLEHWPSEEQDAGTDDEEYYSAETLADWTAASARDDEEAIDAITVITGISRRWVRRHLNGADGRTHVRNVFSSYWPEAGSTDEPDAAKLGSCTVAAVRKDPSLLAALCTVTGMSQRAVSRRVETSDGRFRVRTIFRDVWPAEDSEGGDIADQRYSADEIAEWTVAAARSDDGALDSLVAITGLHPRWVRRHLNRADGRTLMRNLFADRWPSEDD